VYLGANLPAADLAAVGPEVTILAGGAGFQPAPEGTIGMTSLRALSDWARSFSLNFSPN